MHQHVVPGWEEEPNTANWGVSLWAGVVRLVAARLAHSWCTLVLLLRSEGCFEHCKSTCSTRFRVIVVALRGDVAAVAVAAHSLQTLTAIVATTAIRTIGANFGSFEEEFYVSKWVGLGASIMG